MNSELLQAILSREDELLDLPVHQISLLFASLSRFLAMLGEEDEKLNKAFNAFKAGFADKLVKSELDIHDVSALAMPLAAEKVESGKLWSRLARIVLDKNHKIPEEEYLQTVSNLAWAFSKVNHTDDRDFWLFIERAFKTELEKLEVDDQLPKQ